MFHTYLYKPLLNALISIYNFLPAHDLGLAIIVLTLLVRVVLFPIFYKSAKDQAIMQKIAPRLKEIQKSLKHDKEQQVKETLALYKEHKVNPMTQMGFMIIQILILVGLYRVILNVMNAIPAEDLYAFVAAPQTLNLTFLSFFNLGDKNSIVFALLVGASQYFLSKLSTPPVAGKAELSAAEKMSRQMVLIAPLLIGGIAYFFPIAVGIYLLTTTVFSVIQQIIINKSLKNGDTGKHETNN